MFETREPEGQSLEPWGSGHMSQLCGLSSVHTDMWTLCRSEATTTRVTSGEAGGKGLRAPGVSKSSLFLPKRGMQDQSTLSVTRSLRGRAAPAYPCRLSGVERAKLTRTDGLRGPEKVRQMAAKTAGRRGPTPSGDCLVLPRAPGGGAVISLTVYTSGG